MSTTDRHGFLLWSAGFTQSDTILNDQLLKLETKLGLSVLDRDLNQPAGGESNGDCYIVGSAPAGAWASFSANDVVILRNSTWYNVTPIAGWPAWVEDENVGVMFNGTSWVIVSKDLPLDKLDATADPTVNNDTTEGYEVGSKWINVTADKAFVCLDSTGGAAVWTEYGNVDPFARVKSHLSATAAPTVNNDTTEGYEVGSTWWDTTNDEIYLCIDATTAAAVWKQVGSGSGGGGLTPVFIDNTDSPYSASAGELIFVDCATAAVTVNLPATPSDTDRVGVVDASGDAATNNITVGRNGETINGVAEDFIIDQNFGQFDAAYDGTGTDWKAALSGNPTPANVSGKNQSWIPVRDMYEPLVGTPPAALTSEGDADGKQHYQYRGFDSAAVERLYFSWAAPKRWDHGTVTFVPYWATPDANSGDVLWEVNVGANADGDDLRDFIDQSTGGQSLDSALGTAHKLHIGPESAAMTVRHVGAAANPLIIFQVERAGSDGSDTYGSDARLLGMMINWTSDQATDN